MSTNKPATTPAVPDMRSLTAIRARARAEAAAADAQMAHRQAELDAVEAQAGLEHRQGHERWAARRAQLDALDAQLAAQLAAQEQAERAAAERQQQQLEQLRAVAAMAIPAPRQSAAELRAALAALDRDVDRLTHAAERELAQQTDAALSRGLQDRAYRARWDLSHPGGIDSCSCSGCAAWRTQQRGGRVS